MPDWSSGSTWENGLQGAGGGALAGSAFGPIGAGIGGLIGGVAGLFGSQGTAGMDSRLRELQKFYQSRRAPQLNVPGGGRDAQNWLLNQLQGMSQGRGPSLAREMLREAQDTGTRRAEGMAAGGAGPNAALAQYQAQQGAAMNQAQSAQSAAALRQQEQLAALQQYGGVASDLRGQDFNAANANLEAQLRTMGLNDAGQLQAVMAQLGAAGPSMGQQLLAGGAGLAGFLASQRADNRAGSGGSDGASSMGATGYGDSGAPAPDWASFGGGPYGTGSHGTYDNGNDAANRFWGQ
jgi:hypothetical protein